MFEPPYRMKNMMPGMIMLWAGAIVDIPSGWTLCDGTMGTPNLLNTFVSGAGGPFAPGSTGGGATHNHTFTGDGHAHDIGAGSAIAAGTDKADGTTSNPAIGTTDAGNSLPPYHQLCYIMKL